MTLAGKHAVVTGGVSGIGEAIVQALLEAGAKVSTGARRIPDQAGDNPENLLISTLDIRDRESVAAFMAAATAAFGPAGILVNAAGISGHETVTDHSDALWDDTIETNLTGSFRMIRAVLPGMTDRGWGRIVNIGSTAITTGHPKYAAYCASKSGLVGLTNCVAIEAAAHGVTCNILSPSWVDTPMMRASMAEKVALEGKGRTAEDAVAEIAAQNPSGRLVQTKELAAHVLHLCSEAAATTTMQNITVAGGADW